MKTHSIKELILLILMFVIAWNGFAKPVNEPCLTVSRVKLVVIGEDVNHDKDENGDPYWIKMYREYLQSFNADNEIINLTASHLNTYNIVPTGSSNPYQRPKTDEEFNITRALDFNPDAIIVNLEYNDILNDFQANEQIVNIMLIAREANKHHIPIWINTPKPSLFDSIAVNNHQEELKNMIVQRFGPFVVNVWDDFATEQGTLANEYATEDNKHLNKKGQELLLKRLIEADIHQYCARRLYKGGKDISIYSLQSEDIQGSTGKKFNVTVANSGNDLSESIHITLQLENEVTKEIININKVINSGLEGCGFTSLAFEVDDLAQGDYNVVAFISKKVDRNHANDTTSIKINHLAFVPVKPQIKTDKSNNAVALYAININGFSSAFNKQDQANGYKFSNGGDAKLYEIKDVISDENIEASTFRIMAERAFEISAFEVAVDKPGNKLVEVFYKRNIDENKDNSLDYWTLASSQEVEVTESNQQVEILIKDIIMKRNDNVGIYIRTKDISNTTLSKNK